MEKIISIIGTRPQYIKVKPFDSFCKRNNIEHIIVDTNQHYSDSVSKQIIESLDLNINYNLNIQAKDEIEFIYKAAQSITNLLSNYEKDTFFINIYGDTNSSFAAALACYKNKYNFCHIEAGARCNNTNVPEEVNRIYIDSTSPINFCTTEKDKKHAKNSFVVGDLEYELLNSYSIKEDTRDFGLMTIHRQSNINKEQITKIFNFCKKIKKKILFPIHHRLKLQKWFETISIPSNIKIVEPLDYLDMVEKMNQCAFILTDSGGVLKTCPFFGKRTLILRKDVGWTEILTEGYAKFCDYSDSDISWILQKSLPKKPNFYLPSTSPSSQIYKHIKNNLMK